MKLFRRLFPRASRPHGAPVAATLYTRPGCHLCDEMKAEIARSECAARLALVEVDIGSDPELERRYGRSIPVLELGGRPAFKGRLTAADLERKLARLEDLA